MDGRIKTYIKCFDEVIGGGLPDGQVILVAGPPGAMKSSLCFYILYRNAVEQGIPSLYVCLEEEKDAFFRNMESLGMPVEASGGRLILFDAGDRAFVEERAGQMSAIGWTEGGHGESKFLSCLKYAVNLAKERHKVRLLVIDSLDSLVLLSGMQDPRGEIFMLFEWLRELGLTTLVIGETPAAHPLLLQGEGLSSDFLADGIIQIRMEKVDELVYRRYLRCVKMRASEHSPDYFLLVYDDANHEFEVTKAIY